MHWQEPVQWEAPELQSLPPIGLRVVGCGVPARAVSNILGRVARVSKIMDLPLDAETQSAFVGNGSYYPASSYLGRLGTRVLEKIFNTEELTAVTFSAESTFGSHWDCMMKRAKAPWVLQMLVWHAWQSGMRKVQWNSAVDAYEKMRNFTFGLPGFTYHLDFTATTLCVGYSQARRVFLDGSFGILVHYKGRHVMTVAFDLLPDKSGIIQPILRQVQLVEKSGNRFLYSFGCHYFEFVCSAFCRSFADLPTLTTSGADVVKRVVAGYSQHPAERAVFLRDEAPRVKALYDRRFKSLIRRGRKVKDGIQILVRA